ncbi:MULTISPECIES: hydrogen peroxide-dependent heme synthase [Microcella]|uniref:hydrogen peroxide-dependent heme synthase n=1 Tax=Microcella TaxID=337004 RepID=UPI0015CF4686|nr:MULTISPECIES: hydrogen peroxide-dependent heme synthase [Microcella]QOD93728.1 chlorite dismutase family protein [Chryseoglobus sp. 28M-23]
MSDTLAYTLYVVLRRDAARPASGGGVAHAVAAVTERGVTVRGVYDVSGLRADADIMLWLHGADPEALQSAVRTLRRAELLSGLLPTWNAMGVHVQAEFSRSHAPAFMLGKEPKTWLCVYPFVRSYEWYLLPDEERRDMLAEHGRKGSAFTGVLANTVASFALGDYEWLLGLESDELLDLVDMMRDLRYTEARRHVREEVPFYTGRRLDDAELDAQILEVLR